MFGDIDKITRPGMGDGAQVGDHLVGGHADAGIANGECLFVFIGENADSQFDIMIEHLPVGELLEVDACQGIRSVRNQLAQENLALGIQRMDQDIQ